MTPRAYRTRRFSASVSLDAVTGAAAGRRGRPRRGLLARGRLRHGFLRDARGERLKTLYLGRMPESGKVTLKAQLASEVAHIRQLRPDVRIVAIADGAADNWTFLETLSRLKPRLSTCGMPANIVRTASDHAVASDWFERYREVLSSRPCGVTR